VLLPQADRARPVVAEGLRAKGWDVHAVTAYRTTGRAVAPAERAAVGAADAVTFTSASIVEHLVAAVGAAGLPPVVASIGPITTAAARQLGVPVTIEAAESTVAGLVAALEAWWA
jgi:uroporphyrinogen-III synthase